MAMTAMTRKSADSSSMTVVMLVGCFDAIATSESLDGRVDTVTLLNRPFAEIEQNIRNGAVRLCISHAKAGHVATATGDLQKMPFAETIIRTDGNFDHLPVSIDNQNVAVAIRR